MTKQILVIILFLMQLPIYAQMGIGGSFKGGFLIAHQEVMQHLEAHVTAFDLTLEKNFSHKYWADKYKNPIAQLGLSYYDLGHQYTGKVFSLDARLGFGLFSFRNTEFRLRLGTGLGYATEAYNFKTNRRNQVVGSHFNMKMDFAFLFKNNLNENLYIEYGLAASHFSNANFKLPNLGYNLPLLMVRTGWLPPQKMVKEMAPNKSKLAIETTGIITRRQTNISRPVDLVIYGLQARGVKNKNDVITWRAGIDAMMDRTYSYFGVFDIDINQITFSEQFELGIAGGASYNVGPLKIITELGAHVISPFQMKRLFYQRLGFGYDFQNDIILQATLKFARGKADYMELGIGYRLWKK
jgi:hypothetical protein